MTRGENRGIALTGRLARFLPGEFGADTVPVLSDSSKMAPQVSRKKSRQVVEEESDTDIQTSPPPIYRDTLCTFAKGDSLRWYEVYREFAITEDEFPEDLPDREVYLKVKRSKLHLAGAHPAIFPCP